MSDCTYKITSSGEVLTGQPAMKAYLAEGGLDALLPEKDLPWRPADVRGDYKAGRASYDETVANKQDNENEPTGNDRGDKGALASVSPGELLNPEGGRPAGQGSKRSGRPDAVGNGSAGEDAQHISDGSVAGKPRAVLSERPDEVEISGEARPLEEVAESVKNDPPASEPKPRFPARFGNNPGNYRITDADQIGTGTAGQRIRANMAAIRLVLELERENRYPTREEQSVLVKYVGWGGLKNVFKGDNSASKQEREAYAELKESLTPEQLFWMGQSVLNAHYTSPKVVGMMYRALEHFGVDGGRFLEPTVGSGNFIGLMPDSMASGAKWFASEIDPLTSLIAKNLYPDAQVLTGTGFQDAEFSYGRTDVAIGNPPFGDERITDTNKKRAEISGFKIHNYIIAKSAMHLRPGGIMEFVVTSRFLDTADSEARDFLQKNFRFLGAVRLPNDAFAGSAGTEVTTDILFLQRLRDGQREGDDTWLDTAGTIQNEDGETIRLNRYFAENPSMMLGKPSMQGTMYGSKEEFTLKPIDGMDIAEAFERILSRDWRGYQGIGKQRAEDREAAAVAIEYNREDVPIGGFYRDGERIVQRTDDDSDGNTQFRVLTADTPWTEKTTLGDTRLERIKGMMDLRDMAYDLMAAERSDAPQDQLDAKRASLVRRYDAFVAEHGYLNDPANRKLMDDDPRIEFGLEANYTKKISAADSKRLGVPQSPAKAEKTSLLRERVFFPKQEVLSADTPADGYAISLSEKGKLDLDYISELTGLSVDKVTASLSAGESPLIYRDPVLGRWVQEDEYLSGNVKDKLKMARGAGLEANIKALEAVQPVDVAPQDIHAEFGATWIRPSVYEDFLKLFGYTNPQVSVLPKSGAVEATSAGTPGASIFRADVENSDYSIVDVFSAAANRRQLIAYDGSGDDRHINPERTENLGRIRNKMIAIWRDWIKSDAERADLLARDYNEMMNTTVERKYDGVRHLRTVGANPAISLRNSQKDSSWRMIQSSVTLMDHVVGAGKTIAIITGLMERKRLGLSKKPMVVVPNHLVGQWARDWMALYPGANILAATEKDFAKANRRRLFARIATGKFDAIIVGHSSFGFIPVSSEAEVQFVMKEVEFLEDALTEAKTAESSKKGKGDSRRVRGIKNRIAKRMEKIKELQDKPRDNVVSFEDMGVDYLAVDEFHEFKNLEYATTLSNVAGMGSPEGSKKAFDLYMKLRLLQEWGGGVAGATGTPISNSLVEMYSLLRYLNPGALAARNLEQFDAWVKMYASIEPRDEYTAAGKIKQRTVLAAFNNLPELLQMYKQVADTVTMSDLKRITAEQIRTENRMKGESKREEFPVPKVKGGTRRLDIGAPTDEQVEFMDYLIARADILDKMKGKEKQAYAKIDNALWLMNDARKMSLDVRIIDPSVPDNKSNKVNRAARNIKEIYDRTDDDLGAQLVFCDLSTPAKNASKDAKDFIRGMMKTLGFSDDAATASALDGKSYAEQWRYLKMRADMLLDGGDLNDAKRESIEGALEKVSDDNLSALQVADSGFSVYDALKTRLIDSGIPEREIAFIHDATTSDKKRELFDLVKAGRVRVLIGSSAKMGAGTNVQTRLVALHHMDAPWRPSDIEQREGRIIRQGNMFYDRDPDGFEVEIVAYSTERTFDAQMWGVLARKAAFLEQFRHGLRTITEEGSDADSYAEFMAEATGDQIFRQKIQLERELNDIEAEERSSKMKRQASENIVRTASEKQARLDARLAEAKTLAAADLSRVTFDGNAYRNDMYDVLQSETEAFRIENEAFQKAEEAYRITRKAWEDAAGTERGRAPQKPVKPEVPEIGAKRVVEKSEWARFVNALTRKFELIPEAMTRGFEVVAANGTVLPISVSRGSGESVFVTVGGNSVAYATPPRSSIMYASLTPNSIQGTTKGAPQRIAKEISSLAENVRQAQFTLDHVKAVSPEAVADVRNRYEAVKKAVDEASARMAEERAQRDNRFIGRDKTRFGEAAAASEVAAEAPKKIPDNVRFRKVGDSVVVEEKFKPLSLDGLDHEFFTVKDGKTWRVIESGSGLSAGNGDTREQAIGSANATLSRIGVEKFSEVIAKAPKITDSDKLAALSSKGGPAVLRSDFPKTITVDGVDRPTTNSKGQPIHPTEEGLRNFWRWFGDSKAVDEQGRPLVVYHGTTENFDSFNPSLAGAVGDKFASASFFTSSPTIAAGYAQRLSKDAEHAQLLADEDALRSRYGKAVVRQHQETGATSGDISAPAKAAYDAAVEARRARRVAVFSNAVPIDGANIAPVYLRIESPAEIDADGGMYFKTHEKAFDKAKKSDADGVIVRNVIDRANEVMGGASDVFAVFNPTQIKSAIGNAGTFDPASPDIRFRNDYPDTQAFREWFGSSKMTNKAGEPLLFMHGSPASFEAFDLSKLGASSSHTSSGLGHFFTRDRATAEKYADGGNIYTGWLRIEKPYVMMLEEAQAFDDAAESAKRRAELQKQGYDGAVILDDEGKTWATVAFEPWQFKSTDNNGSFDEFDDRMRFRDDPSSMRDAPAVPRDQAEEFIRSFVAEFPGAPPIMLVDSFDQLPKDIQKDALAQGSGPTRAKGAMKNGATYVVLNNHHSMADLEATVFHEILGHTGIRKLLGPQFSQKLNKLFVGLGGYSGLKRIMEARGMGQQFEGYFRGIQQARASNPDAWTDALAKSILTEEVFAHIAEQKNAKQLRDRFMALVGMVRDWLRRHGFMDLASLGESDIVFMLQHAREGLRDGSGIVRDGATVGENEIVGEDGRPIAKEGSPDYEALKLLSGRLGLRERSGPTVFKDGLRDDGNEGQDAGMDDAKNVAGKQAPNPAGDVEQGGATPRYTSRNWQEWYELPQFQSDDQSSVLFNHGRGGYISQVELRTTGVFDGLFALRSPGLSERGSDVTAFRIPNDKMLYQRDLDYELDYEDVAEALIDVFPRKIEQGDDSFDEAWKAIVEDRSDFESLGLEYDGSVREDSFMDILGYKADDAGEASWFAQKLRGRLAAKLGYQAVQMDDENGSSWYIAPGVKSIPLPNEQSTSARPDVAVFRTDTYAQPRGQAAKEVMGNVISALKEPSAKEFNILHKTISTPLHKASVSKDYAEVFILAQEYMSDTARFAADPASAAPGLLPAYDSIKQAFNRFMHGDKNAKLKDAVADAIFKGTLAGEDVTSGRVWTDEELRSRFDLGQEQIGLYREARAAIEASLDATAAGLAWQIVKKYIPHAKSAIRSEPGSAETIIDGAMRQAEEELREVARYQAAVEADGAIPEGAAAKTIRKAQDVAEARKAAESIFLRSDALKAGGYAPLMRFGKYSVDAVRTLEDGTQERITFKKFETEIEAKTEAQRLRKIYPDAEVLRSVMSEDAWKIYKGVDPELVSLFAESLDGVEGLAVKSDVLQEWYRNAVNERSSFKRMVHRKGTDGFDTDITRVLASFITSNSRLAARQFNMGDMAQAIADMQDRKVSGDVVDDAMGLKEYMDNPEKPFKALKGMMFAFFLGGSVASALLNLTQPIMMTMPYLSQFGAAKAGTALASATKDAWSGKVSDPELSRAMARASKDGVVDPQQIHHLYQEGMRSFIMKLPMGSGLQERAQGFMTMWGMMFGATENFNRRLTFIAAYRMARENPELGNPYDFAAKAVNETQGIYNDANIPNWARGNGSFGAVGVAAFTFKQYSIGYVELLIRLAKSGKNGRAGAAMMLGTLVLMSGMQGAPGADDLEDIIDTVSQYLGYTGNSRLALRKSLESGLGSVFGQETAKAFAHIVMYGGLSVLPGDAGGRIGMGNLFPATAFAKPSEQNRASQIAEIFGPPLGLATQVLDAGLAAESGGGILGVAKAFAPVAVRNWMKAYDMASTGQYSDARGRKVVDVTLGDAALKFVGIQPTVVADDTKDARLVNLTKQRIVQVKSAISSLKAQAIADRDPEMKAKADAMVTDWNQKNPDAPIRINDGAMLRRVKEINTERRERLLKAMPKDFRAIAAKEYE